MAEVSIVLGCHHEHQGAADDLSIAGLAPYFRTLDVVEAGPEALAPSWLRTLGGRCQLDASSPQLAPPVR